VQPFEKPSRAETVLAMVRESDPSEISAPESFSLEPVLAVHDAITSLVVGKIHMLPMQVKNIANAKSGVVGEGDDRRYTIGVVTISEGLLPPFAVIPFSLRFRV